MIFKFFRILTANCLKKAYIRMRHSKSENLYLSYLKVLSYDIFSPNGFERIGKEKFLGSSPNLHQPILILDVCNTKASWGYILYRQKICKFVKSFMEIFSQTFTNPSNLDSNKPKYLKASKPGLNHKKSEISETRKSLVTLP